MSTTTDSKATARALRELATAMEAFRSDARLEAYQVAWLAEAIDDGESLAEALAVALR